MAHKDNLENGKRALNVGSLVLLAALVTCTAGCHSASEGNIPPPPSPAAAAASRNQEITAIQNNPNIPAATKASITAQLQGQSRPAAGTPAAHP